MSSKSIKDYRVIIVGAGISGLTIGYILAKRGMQVTILEKEAEVGGLSRSFKYDGFTYDYGPHGLFKNTDRPGQFIKDVMGDELLVVPKKSGVLLKSKFYDWPLKPDVIFKLPWNVKFKALIDLIYRRKYEGGSLKEYLLNRYGETLYKIDFEPYTKKFLDVDPLNLDPDWMKIGIKRAGAGEKLKLDSLWQIFFSLFKKKSESFTYPEGGAIQFPMALAKKIIENNGVIVNNAEVLHVEAKEDKIVSVSNGRTAFAADYFIWTAPITILEDLIYKDKASASNLDYISMVFFNISINERVPTEYRWCYFVDPDIFFPRCSISNLFSGQNSPVGKTALTAEITCRKNSEIWNHPQKYQDRVINDLKKIGFIKDISNIENIHIEKLEYAYPIYRLGYREKLMELEDRLKRYSNLVLSGRQGTFWYCNMDHCVEQGVDIAYNLIKNLNE